jgi:hypothetical protein
MRKFILLIMIICCISASCVDSHKNEIEAVGKSIKTQRFIGRFKENVSLSRDFKDKVVIEKEQGESFDIYCLDISSPIIKFEYTMKPQNKLLYIKPLDSDRILKVKQMGNGEENNVLVLEGKIIKNIAKNIAYSTSALISISPGQKYVLYCTADDILNNYSLYIYDLEKEQSLQLSSTVSEELLNDMEGNIAWSPDEANVAVSNKLVFNTSSGNLIGDINAEKVIWSAKGSKLAYIKSEMGFGKAICILDISTANNEEVFLVNQGEYLPGYLVWNEKETNLGFVTALTQIVNEQVGISPYHAVYSLDLTAKEAVRIDTILGMDPKLVEQVENIQYNGSGSIMALTIANNLGCDLYIYNIKTGNREYSINIEYLHNENNESYVCSSGDSMYFVQGQSIIEMDAGMKGRLIYQSEKAIEDIYLSKNGNSMIIIEKTIDETVLRQLQNFTSKSM